jgi:hypothetical protein
MGYAGTVSFRPKPILTHNLFLFEEEIRYILLAYLARALAA